jgi:hypothetical protein
VSAHAPLHLKCGMGICERFQRCVSSICMFRLYLFWFCGRIQVWIRISASLGFQRISSFG